MILSGDGARISSTMTALAREIRNLVDDAVYLTFNMKGAVSYHDLLMMTPFERERVREFIQKRMDDINKSKNWMYSL
jgi:hypothetical protein